VEIELMSFEKVLVGVDFEKKKLAKALDIQLGHQLFYFRSLVGNLLQNKRRVGMQGRSPGQ